MISTSDRGQGAVGQGAGGRGQGAGGRGQGAGGSRAGGAVGQGDRGWGPELCSRFPLPVIQVPAPTEVVSYSFY